MSLKYYLAIKACHLVAVIAWMAGLFYLPRLFVYHIEYPQSGNVFTIMERKLYLYIMTPAMIMSLISGWWLLIINDFTMSYWVMTKITCVILLVVFQLQLWRWHNSIKNGKCHRTSIFFRFINELPTLLLIVIIVCVTFKKL